MLLVRIKINIIKNIVFWCNVFLSCSVCRNRRKGMQFMFQRTKMKEMLKDQSNLMFRKHSPAKNPEVLMLLLHLLVSEIESLKLYCSFCS